MALSWEAAFACVNGRKHEKCGTACQDAAHIETEGPALAICVCDGAGSARYSEIGANRISKCICRFLLDQEFEGIQIELLGAQALLRAQEEIESEIRERGGNLGDYACTLVALLLNDDRGISIHLGDGLISLVESGAPQVFSPPENSEFINQTTFVTSPNAKDRIRVKKFAITDTVTSFVLMTDGAQATLYNKRQNLVSQAVEQMAAWLDNGPAEEVGYVLASTIREHILVKTEDDCTIAVVRRRLALKPFSCKVCQRWDLRRVKDEEEKRSFRVACTACGAIAEMGELRGVTYPLIARDWVQWLLSRGLTRHVVHEITGISFSTFRRWSRSKS